MKKMKKSLVAVAALTVSLVCFGAYAKVICPTRGQMQEAFSKDQSSSLEVHPDFGLKVVLSKTLQTSSGVFHPGVFVSASLTDAKAKSRAATDTEQLHTPKVFTTSDNDSVCVYKGTFNESAPSEGLVYATKEG